jgi:hypothetical protein
MVMDVLVYGKSLLERGCMLAKEGKYREIASEVFKETNQGHSGWILEMCTLYEYPQNEEELLLRNAFTQLLKKTLSGIKDVCYPSASADDRPPLLEAARRCLELLGESAPDEFILWQNAEFAVCPKTRRSTYAFCKKARPQEPREYLAICDAEHDHLTVAEHLNVLEVRLLGELIKNGCKERISFPFAPKPERDIDMRECPADIRPSMREFWELLQVVRRMKKLKLG